MSIMECPACHSQMDSEASECPVCHLLNPRITGSVENKKEIVDQLAARKLEQVLGRLEIGVEALAHRASGDHYVSDGKRYVSLFGGSDLVFDQVIWSDHPFGQSKADAHAKLELVLKNEEGDKHLTLNYTTPELDGLWYVGAKLTAGFRCSFLVGDAQTACETDEISLI